MSSNRKYDNVLVFGPTGDVGGLVALEAHNRGAKVWLAMRDITKPIPAIPTDVEKTGNFVRVQADLSDAASVARAVAESGVKAVYMYIVHGGADFGRAALQVMRDNGVEYVVFLSSYSVKGEGNALRALPPTNWIPYEHAQVEITIEDIGFPYFTTLRPAWFASNYFRTGLDRSAKPPKAILIAGYEDKRLFDNVTPEDVGAVGGAVLVERPSDRKETIWICGPDTCSPKEGWELVKKVTGRTDIETILVPAEQFIAATVAKGIPQVLVDSLLSSYERWQGGYEAEPEFKVGMANIAKYAGRAPMTFVQYLEAHKAEWAAI
uniref:NmrA-like domain-containing protein n=1 Tax=Mycena chlorophos TaxID=658473 RepID=A0ABQ0L9C6_MYCCL|nr:predicted protein [Mycena chlorophos]